MDSREKVLEDSSRKVLWIWNVGKYIDFASISSSHFIKILDLEVDGDVETNKRNGTGGKV